MSWFGRVLYMGQHSVPRGEYSSYGQPNGAPYKQKGYKGKHHADDAVKGYRVGQPNRATDEKGGKHSR